MYSCGFFFSKNKLKDAMMVVSRVKNKTHLEECVYRLMFLWWVFFTFLSISSAVLKIILRCVWIC